MNLKELLEKKKAELATLEGRIKQISEDIEAIQRVMDMDISPDDAITNTAIQQEREKAITCVSQASTSVTLKEIYGNFGKFLTQFCFENGLSQKEMGDLLGASSQSVGQWMHGCMPAPGKRERIADTIDSISSYRAKDIMTLFV